MVSVNELIFFRFLYYQFVIDLYSSGGFAFLPFLWTVNAFWFFRDAFYKPHFEEQSQIRQCISHIKKYQL
jgi:hypothetical protein